MVEHSELNEEEKDGDSATEKVNSAASNTRKSSIGTAFYRIQYIIMEFNIVIYSHVT